MDATLFDEMAVFVKVVDAGSYTSAARTLGVPKSTLSRAVARLEDARKVRLLARTTRSLSLTPAGKAFYDLVAPHIAGLYDAGRALGEGEGQPRGTVRVTAAPDVGEAVLGEMLPRFAARYPEVRVEVDLSGRVVDLAREGFDAGIRATRRVSDPSLVARKLAVSELGYYASPSYLARRGTPRTPDDLRGHECVHFRPTGAAMAWSLVGPEAATQSVLVEGRLGGNDFAFLRTLLRGGAGVGPLPLFSAIGDVASGSLVRVIPEWTTPGATIFFVYPSGRHVPRRLGVFRDALIEAFRQLEQSR